MRHLRTAAVTLAFVGSAIVAGEASAMPVVDVVPAVQQMSGLQDVRWVCGPYRCWWQPGPYWGHPYWHHWHRHGW